LPTINATFKKSFSANATARGRRLIDAERGRRPAQGSRARDPLGEFEIGPAAFCAHADSPLNFSD
jgi:hypothetical protein